MQFFSTFGSFATPIYAGWVYDRTGSYLWALVVFAVLAGVAALLFFAVRAPKVPSLNRTPATEGAENLITTRDVGIPKADRK
jgi:MFS family permease